MNGSAAPEVCRGLWQCHDLDRTREKSLSLNPDSSRLVLESYTPLGAPAVRISLPSSVTKRFSSNDAPPTPAVPTVFSTARYIPGRITSSLSGSNQGLSQPT